MSTFTSLFFRMDCRPTFIIQCQKMSLCLPTKLKLCLTLPINNNNYLTEFTRHLSAVQHAWKDTQTRHVSVKAPSLVKPCSFMCKPSQEVFVLIFVLQQGDWAHNRLPCSDFLHTCHVSREELRSHMLIYSTLLGHVCPRRKTLD